MVEEKGEEVMMVDMDADRKRRIAKFLEDNVNFVNEDVVRRQDIAELLLRFEQYLDKCEAERQRE